VTEKLVDADKYQRFIAAVKNSAATIAWLLMKGGEDSHAHEMQ
jgi:hypothetical protein